MTIITGKFFGSPSDASSPRLQMRVACGYGAWIAAGSLLMIAAVLKGYDLSKWPAVAGNLDHRSWQIVEVEAEALLGLWMLLGPRRRWAWYVVMTAFICFVGVTIYKIATHATSCGCFGQVHVNPWLTLLVDLTMLAGLWVTRPVRIVYRPRTTASNLRWLTLVIVGTCMGIAGAWKMIPPSAGTLNEVGLAAVDGSLIVLEPQKWLGKREPLSPYMDIGTQLEHGRWIVVLYHADCPLCRGAVANFLHMASTLREQGSNTGVALIEMPPYAAGSARLVPAHSDALTGRLTETREWFAVTPLVLLVSDGTVIRVTEGEESLRASKQALSEGGSGSRGANLGAI